MIKGWGGGRHGAMVTLFQRSESEVSNGTGASDNGSGEAKLPARQGGPIGKKKVS